MSDYRYGKPKVTKVNEDIDPKYFPPKAKHPVTGQEIPWDDSPETRAHLLNYARMQREKEAKIEAKGYQEEQRRLKEREQQQREQREREREPAKDFPERQFNMLLSGKYPHRDYGTYGIATKPVFYGTGTPITTSFGISTPGPTSTLIFSLEPALNYLRKKWPLMIELDTKTRKRLDYFGKPDELYTDLINRMLDIAEKKQVKGSKK